ncbi:hypothetical protein Hanom_Chr04g00345081 [Helianthus anomalus]
MKNWKDNFFWLDDLCLPSDMMSLTDALKVPSFSTLDFDYDELVADEEPFLKQISSAAHEIRPLVDPQTSATIIASPESAKEAACSSVVQVRAEPLVVEEDNDLELRELDQALLYPSFSVATKGKGVSSESAPKGLIHKRKAENLQLREEAVRARSAPSATFSGGFLPVDEAEVKSAVTSKDGGKFLGEVKMLYRRWVEVESVKENLDKEIISLKRKMQRTPDTEKKLAQLAQDLAA